MKIELSEDRNIDFNQVIGLYRANGWSSAEKPDLLKKALQNSHALVTAWFGNKLVGLGNTLSDGHLVVYYPHLLVHPEYQRMGIGKRIVEKFKELYADFHQHVLVADGDAIKFYESCGFELAGKTRSMWIYSGKDH